MKYIIHGLDTESRYSCITYEGDEIINHVTCVEGNYNFTTFKPGSSFEEYKNHQLVPRVINSDESRRYMAWKKEYILGSSKKFNIKTKVIIHDIDMVEIPIGTRFLLSSVNNEIAALMEYKISKGDVKDTITYNIVYIHISNLNPFIIEYI